MSASENTLKMSLLKRFKDRQLASEKELAARHSIVKMGVDRNVRDAYFQGLVFAAVANDDQIDDFERARLRELGEALELATADVAETIQSLAGMDDDTKMSIIEECARQLVNVEVAECFLKEFSELWLLGGGKEDEFGDFKSQLIDWMGDAVKAEEESKARTAAEVEAKRKARDSKRKAVQKKPEKKKVEKTQRIKKTKAQLQKKMVKMVVLGRPRRTSKKVGIMANIIANSLQALQRR